MGLEHWDSHRKKWILYFSDMQHREDCEQYPIDRLPHRVFLDTNVINLLVKYDEQIFSQCEISENINGTDRHDVEALMHVFYIGTRANWEIFASMNSISEIERTKNADVREKLLDYAVQLVDLHQKDSAYALDLGRRLRDTSLTAALPDVADRELLGNAIGFNCDVFCTCDRRTIVRHRERLSQLPIRILTPIEWWAHVKPWGALWC